MEYELPAPTIVPSVDVENAATASVVVFVLQAKAAVDRPLKLWFPFAPSRDPLISVQVRPPSGERRMPSPYSESVASLGSPVPASRIGLGVG